MNTISTSQPSDLDAKREAVLSQLDRKGWVWLTGVQFSQPPCLRRTLRAEIDHSTALANAKEYLEQAGFHPMNTARKKKRGKKDLNPQALLYTRGARSAYQLFLVPSPKNMRIDVEISGVPVENYSCTELDITYDINLPSGVGVAKASCNFWAQEILELEQAIGSEQIDRQLSSQYASRAAGYCLLRNYLQIIPLLALIYVIVPGLIPLTFVGGLIFLVALHVLLAMRWGR